MLCFRMTIGRCAVAMLSILLGVGQSSRAQPGMPPQDVLKQAEPRLLNVTTMWVGNTWGGWTGNFRMPTGQEWPGQRGTKLQPGIQAIAVTTDGTMLAVGRGDGKRYAILRDGHQIEGVDDAPYHIWFSSAAAADDKYFYFAQRHPGRGNGTEKTSDGQPKFTPQGERWSAVMRLDRQGKFAPFPGGFGDWAHAVVVDKSGQHLRGIASDNQGRVFVSNPTSGEVLAYDRETMKPMMTDGKPVVAKVAAADRLAFDAKRQWVWAVSPRVMGSEPMTFRIRAGGDRIGEWGRDLWRWKGPVVDAKEKVDLSGVTESPAPEALYATAFTTPRSLYKLHGFMPNSPCKIRLHMFEPTAQAPGERVFDVRINNVTVLSKFDLLKEIGSRNKAIVREFSTMASGEGEVAIDFDAGKGGKTACYSAIEVTGVRTTQEVKSPASLTAFTRDLAATGRQIQFPPTVEPVGVAFGPDGLLYVADNGPDLQVKIYDVDAPNAAPTRTLGVKGGAFAGPVPGTLAPDRFAFLTDIGLDGAGNIYVAQDGNPVESDISGASLTCFAPGGAMKWQLDALTFMDEPDWDRGPDGTQEGVLYQPQRKLLVDPDGPAGMNWSTTAFTHDRFKFKHDLRSFDRGLDRDNVFIRYVDGQKFMVVAGGGSEGKPLSVYRFEPGSEIAIPCAAYGPSAQAVEKFPGIPETGEWFWTDRNRDGNYQSEEYVTRTIPYKPNDKFEGMSFFGLSVDRDGGLWFAQNDRFVRYFKPHVTDGILGYRFEDSLIWKVPTEFDGRVGRISYDKATDTMYLSGVLPPTTPATMTVVGLEKPDTRQTGNCIARFDGWLKSAGDGPIDPAKLISPPKAAWVREIPFDSTRNIDRHAAIDLPVMMTAEGDYVFMGYARLGRVRVYRASDGVFVGIWELGPSQRIEDQKKGNQLSNSPLNYGLMDSPIGMRVMKRRDGSYLLTYHDNFLSHTTLYVWRPEQKPPAAVWDLRTAADGAGVKLEWTPPASAVSYDVERYIASGATKWTMVAEQQTTPELIDAKGLLPGVTTYYRLRARNAAGELSDYSNVKFAVPAK